MKKLIVILMCFYAYFAYSHKNVVVERTIGKVQLHSSVCDYTEFVNQTIIIAQYADLILKDLNYNDSIQLMIIQQSDIISLSAHRDNKNTKKINFWYSDTIFDTKQILNLIYQVCKNPDSVKKNRGILAEEVMEDEHYINQLLQHKIQRPSSVEQVDKMLGYNYYTQNNRYYFYNLDNPDKLVFETDKVYQIRSINSNKLLIFRDDTGFVFIKGENVYKHNFQEPFNNKLMRFTISLPSYKILTISRFYSDKVSIYEMDKNLFVEDINLIFEE